MQVLIENGANRNLKSNRGRTCMDIAENRGHFNIIAYLKSISFIRPEEFKAGFTGAESYRIKSLETYQEARRNEERAAAAQVCTPSALFCTASIHPGLSSYSRLLRAC